MAFVPLIGFAPDMDPTTPGIITDCDGWLPSTRGMHTSYTAADADFDALSAACKGLYVSRLNDGTTKTYAGTATKLYELTSGTWTDRSAGGGTYTSTTAWRWATVGGTTYASSPYAKLSKATTGAFATVSTGGTDAPKAAVLCTNLGFLIAGNYDNGTAYPDGVYWSALNAPDDWRPDVATQCGYVSLRDTPGPITAMRTLNEQIVVYKARSMFVGTYQGPPVLWGFRLVSPDIGAVSQESVVDVAYAHFWIGYNDIWKFDSTVPTPIGQGIREWFYARVDRTNLDKIQGLFDRDRNLIYWFYPTPADAGVLTKYIVFNLTTGKWGAGTMTIEWASEVLTTGDTYDSFGDGSTWDSLPALAYDSGSFSASLPYPAVMTTAHKLAYLAGAAGTSTFTTGRIGDEEQVALLRRVSPRWVTAPTVATLTNKYAMTAGATLTTDAARTMTTSKRFDMLRAARWHAASLSTTGDAELTGFTIDAQPAGTE